MYERNYKLLSSKFRELFFPTLFTSMTGNISIFLDSLIVSNLLGATVLASIQPINPLITFVNMIYWMIGLGGSVLCAVSKAEFDYEKSNSIFSVSIKSLSGDFSDEDEDFSDDDEDSIEGAELLDCSVSLDDDFGTIECTELLDSSRSLEEDDSGSTEGVELLESSDSSGTLVISGFSSLQAVSDTIENAATAAIAQT